MGTDDGDGGGGARRALVTAASSGLGGAVARRLVAEGYSTTIVARDSGKLSEAHKQLTTVYPGADVRWVSLDLEDPEAVDSFAAEQLSGSEAPHILVYSTGGPPLYPPGEEVEADLVRHLQSHSLSLMSMTRRLAPQMQERGWGRIVTIMSRALFAPRTDNILSSAVRLPAWAMLKTYSLSPRYSNVTFNAVLPGLFDTERFRDVCEGLAAESGRTVDTVRAEFLAAVPAGRVGDPDELAALCLFLVSDAAGYLNGERITIDGGSTGAL